MTTTNVSHETIQLINIYIEHLLKWNKTHNLIRGKHESIEAIMHEHIADCFDLIKIIGSSSKQILDVGSGNGIPGIILGICDYHVHLTEIDCKKLSFLKYILSGHSLVNVTVSDDVYTINKPFDIVTSRGFSSLKTLISIQKSVSRGTISNKGYYFKGRKWREEIEEAMKTHQFNWKWHPTNVDKGIIEVIVENTENNRS